MRRLFILAFVANVALSLISLHVLPERVAIHFGADGTADGWGPNYADAALMTGVQMLLLPGLPPARTGSRHSDAPIGDRRTLEAETRVTCTRWNASC